MKNLVLLTYLQSIIQDYKFKAEYNTNDNDIIYDWAINYTYDLTPYYVDYELHLRPVLNLKSNTIV